MIIILLNNGYPLDYIFNNINNRTKKFLYNVNKRDEQNGDKKFFIIPFVKEISDKFSHIANKYDLRTAYYCNNKLNRFIKTGKDILEHQRQSNVVYRISCLDCDAKYIGQTKRQLKTRIREHRQDINRKSGSPSVISHHKIENNHEFNWDHVEVLDRETSYEKRLISEMVHIKRHKSALNKQSDTERLPDSYLPVINLFPL